MAQPKSRPTVAQKLLLILFGLGLLAAGTALLELTLRAVGAGEEHLFEDPFVGFSGGRDLFVRAAADDGSAIYRTSPEKLAFFNLQEFPTEKGEETFRIFALGGSTTAGRPYDADFAFPAWLGRFLDAADTDRRFEVVNAGGISYASYRVALLMRELVRHEPDLFVVYTGHNEFLEERTYSGIIHQNPVLRGLRQRLNGLRSYTLARHAVRTLGASRRDLPTTLDVDVATRLDTWRGLDLYQRDDELRTSIVNHFEYNLRQMVAIARDADVEILFVKPVSNLKDFSPFKSEHASSLGKEAAARHRDLLEGSRAALRQEQLSEACTLAEEASALDSSHAEASYLLGRCLFLAKRFEEARRAFVVAKDADVAPLRALEAQLEVLETVTGDLDVPMIDLPSLLEQESLARSGHSILGTEHLLDHVHPDTPVHGLIAGKILEHLVRLDVLRAEAPPSLEARRRILTRTLAEKDDRYYARRDLNLAKVLGWAGKLAEAEAPLQRAATVLTDEAEVFLNLGIVLQRTGRLAEATPQLERALELDPASPPAHFNLGVAYSAAGRPGEALEAFRQAVALRPDYPEAHYNLGLVLGRNGNWDEALSAFQRSLELRGDTAEIHRQLAVCYRMLDRDEAARLSLERAVALDPGVAAQLTEQGLAFAREGRLTEAYETLSQALAADTADAEAHFGLGLVHSARGELESAVAAYRRAIALDPDHSRALNNLGILLARRGELEAAREALVEALRIQPDYADAHFNLGIVYDARGLPAEAVRSIERALALDPDNARFRQALELLLAAGARNPDRT